MTTKAGSDIQDAWHYFDSVLGGETFGREARSLKGRVECYENGRENAIEAAEASKLSDDTYHDIWDLARIDDIEDERQLRQAAKRGRTLVERLALALDIDPTTGETPDEWSSYRRTTESTREAPRRQPRVSARRRR